MANFKKGIALALVATTAFTFAPVANLGTPVVAEAATNTFAPTEIPVKDAAANGVELSIKGKKGQKTVEGTDKDAVVDDTAVSGGISLNDGQLSGGAVTVTSTNTDVARINGSGASFVIEGVANGSTTVEVKSGDKLVYTIHVSVRTASKAARLKLGDTVRANVTGIDEVDVLSDYYDGTEENGLTLPKAHLVASSDESIIGKDGAIKKDHGTVTLTYEYNSNDLDGVDGNGTGLKISKTVTVLPEKATLTVEGKATNAAGFVPTTPVKVVELTKENNTYQINANLKDADSNQKIVYTDDKDNTDGISVDSKTGLVTATAQAFVSGNTIEEVIVKVTKDGADDSSVATAKIAFVAKAEATKLTSLKVTADGQEKEAKATVKPNGTVDSEPATATFDKVVLSTDDKQTLDLAIVATPDKAVITSDNTAVVEVNGTTLTAKKAGKANVTVKVASDANYFGNATITIPVEVISGKANNAIVTNSVTLSKTVKTAKDYAKATVDKTVLAYRFVKYDAATKTYVADNPTDVTLDAKTGELKYITENAGSVIVEVTGKAPAGAADPKPAYVTVSYSNKKEASKLAVETKSLNVEAGKTAAIVATGTALTFASSDETIATVAADGTVTGVKTGVAIVTVTDAGDENTEGGSVDVPVYVKAKAAVVVAKPAKVTSLKVANVKGAKVKVSFKKSAKATGYLVTYKVGKKTVKKTTTKTALTLSVKKGAKVKVSVKAFNKNAAGAKQYSAAVTKTLKTDKK